MPAHVSRAEDRQLNAQRWRLLRQLSAALDKPMTVLAFVWLVLLVIDLTQELSGFLLTAHYVIWGVFALHFALEFLIAPHKWQYIRRNWLTVIALALPALRVVRVFRAFRVLRAARAARGVSLVRLLTSLNRGIRAIRHTLQRRGVGYVAALTLLVTFSGAAAMYSFERPESLRADGLIDAAAGNFGLHSYGESLWWTAMMMTTMGTEYWPRTVEGRILCFFLALYAFAIFGYITATIASYFLGQDVSRNSHATGEQNTFQEVLKLRAEIEALREQLRASLPDSKGNAERNASIYVG